MDLPNARGNPDHRLPATFHRSRDVPTIRNHPLKRSVLSAMSPVQICPMASPCKSQSPKIKSFRARRTQPKRKAASNCFQSGQRVGDGAEGVDVDGGGCRASG